MGATARRRLAALAAVLVAFLVIPPTPAGAGPDLVDPVDLAIGPDGSTYVADQGTDQVVRYPAGGGAPTAVAFTGLVDLTGVAVGPDGDVVVADHGSVLVRPSGGGVGQTTLPGRFGFTAREVAVDGAGTVYAFDGTTVVRWTNGAGPATTHAVVPSNGLAHGLAAADDGTVLVGYGPGHLVWYVPAGGGDEQALDLGADTWPWDVAVGAAGVHVVASHGTEVVTYSPQGAIGSVRFNHPISASAIAVAADGRVSVTDETTKRVVSQEPTRLRVTTTPPVPAAIEVDGTERDSWGLDWMPIGLGSHDVCFRRVPGYATPPCQAVTVGPTSQTTAVDGAYDRLGYLQVSTSPAVPSTISVDGVARNDWGLWTEVPTGSHEVCFGAVVDRQAPACRVVDVVAGQTTSTVGTFVDDPSAPGPDGLFGYLRATTSPPTDVSISVDGTVRNTWGLDWLKLPVGDHEVCFDRPGVIVGQGAGRCTTVSIADRTTDAVAWSTEPSGFLRVSTDPPLPVAITVDDLVVDAYGSWAPSPTTGGQGGTRTVCFGAMAGFATPACQDVTVAEGATTEVVGTFTPLP